MQIAATNNFFFEPSKVLRKLPTQAQIEADLERIKCSLRQSKREVEAGQVYTEAEVKHFLSQKYGVQF